jgi:hypothetical protein
MSDNTKPPLPTVAKLRADIQHHRDWWPSNPLGTAVEAVDALERLIAANPPEVFGLLDELRGGHAR